MGPPASGSLIYMMSKEAYFTGKEPPNLDHLVFDLPRMDGAARGANLVATPIYFQQLDRAPITGFYVVMSEWSDGTSVNADSQALGKILAETFAVEGFQTTTELDKETRDLKGTKSTPNDARR